MKLKRKLLVCICLLSLMGSTIGCGAVDEKGNIYTDNDKIAQEGENFSFAKRTCNDESSEKLDMEYNVFSGVNTIWIMQSKGNGEITFNYNSAVERGDFKAVLVHPNKEVENIFEGTAKESRTIKLTEGKYFFRIVGKKAKGKFKISNIKNENVNIRQARIY